jgi:cytochrome c oxidase subunit 1
MHWLGLISHARVAPGTPLGAVAGPFSSIRSFVTVATLLTIAAQAVFLFNFIWSLVRGERAADNNPWRAATLEWSVSSPPPLGNFAGYEPVVYREAYEASDANGTEGFVPQVLAPACDASEVRSAEVVGDALKRAPT